MKKYDIVVIGAGISGCVLAERYASTGKKVLVLEKRNHIGGNCYDYYDEHGVLVSKYGAHLFHTNYEQVWKYVNRFTAWLPYEHKVLAQVDGHLVPVPVNITTVNKIFGLNIQTETEMEAWLDANQEKIEQPKNGEEAALARVGKELYEKIFKSYTKKQWDKFPAELDAEVLNRIPVRTNFDDRYFSDKYQAQPVNGYTQMFDKMLANPNITVLLNTDYFDIRKDIFGYEKLFYTGPVDRFFDFKYSLEEKLEYRSINFVMETHDQEYFQENSVINYPAMEDGEFTRIVEYKHMTGQKHPKTTISREFTVEITDPAVQEPYYPVLNPRNREIYAKYKTAADGLTDVHFVGRLANYKYFNMDEAFKNALDLFNSLTARQDMQKQVATLPGFTMAPSKKEAAVGTNVHATE